jgi:hypothetical protein
MQRPLTLLALAALAFTGLNALRKKHHERLANTPKAKPEALQTWEGEGGGLPNGGPSQTVSPVVSDSANPATPPRDDDEPGNLYSPARDPAL